MTPRACAPIALLALVCGCAPTLRHAPPRPLPPDLQVGRLAERTTFEQTDASGQPLTDSDDLHDDDRGQRKRNSGFIAGVVASAVGGVTAIAFGAAGQITENQLDDGYRDGLSRSEESDFQSRGEAFNGVAIGGAALAVVGLGVTAIILGIDHHKCGNLIKSRRKECRERGAK